LWSLLGFVLWTIALLGALVVARTALVRSGSLRLRDLRADEPHGGERYRRLMRAHLNCTENLPLFGSVVLVAAVRGFRDHWFDVLCVAFLVFRVGQTIVHISSGRSRAVLARAGAYFVQVLCILGLIALQIL
jgi:uncharacterized MAPEG superfamily protein